jgi:hypothetical protein
MSDKNITRSLIELKCLPAPAEVNTEVFRSAKDCTVIIIIKPLDFLISKRRR